MKSAAAALIAAILTACGGGGDDSAPPPSILYEDTVTASGTLGAGEGPRALWQANVRGQDMLIGRVTSGEACFEGEWVQTGAAAAPVRLDVESGAPVVMSGPVQIAGTVSAGQVLTVPFRVCRPFSSTATGRVQVSAVVSIRTTGGATYALGSYTLRARWVYTGS